MALRTLVSELGKPYSDMLKIDLKKEPFKWLLASVLFGARINETIAINTYREFEKEELIEPDAILKRGWDGLVEVLDRGGYVRYDFKTADKLLELCRNLTERYGDMDSLYRASKNSQDLEENISALAKGIGETTVNIFLREMREVWEKANPEPQYLVMHAAKNLGIKDIKSVWKKEFSAVKFIHWETALLRLGKDFCRKKKCKLCIAKKICLVCSNSQELKRQPKI